MTRRDATPTFEPLEFEWLVVFLANFQRLATPADDLDGLLGCIEQLACYPATAGLWESEFLPARSRAYATSWLDSAMMEGSLRWVGGENRRVTFYFEEDFALMQEEIAENLPHQIESNREEEIDVGAHQVETRENDNLDNLLPDETGRYDFSSLLRSSKLSSARLTYRLWEFVWSGHVANDTFLALRRGILSKFKAARNWGRQRAWKRSPYQPPRRLR